MHRLKRIFCVWVSIALLAAGLLPAAGRAADNLPSLDTVLKEVEKRYTGSQFSAEFLQESTIRSMEITDFASGRLYVRYPGMMRWEYEKPERQAIITDGKKLWIYRPQDNLVMVGGAPVFFRDGKGASFLSDISLVRKKFSIQLARAESEYLYELKMKPNEGNANISEILLYVIPKSYQIARIVTRNGYGDDTRIDIVSPQFNASLDSSLFSFEIPPGADVQKIEE